MSTRANTRRKPQRARRRMAPRRALRMSGLAALIMAGSAAGAWGLASLNTALSVTHWHIDAPDSLRAAIRARLEGQPMDFVHTFPPLMRTRLLAAIPELADVRIARRMSGELAITAVPRRPVANWVDPAGHMLLVAGDGTAYPGTERVAPILPMLRMPEAQLARASALLAHLAKLSRHKYAHLSEMVAVDGAWKLYFDRGQSWVIPQHDAEDRVDRLYALMAEPRWHKDAWRVDARMDDRWFIRPAHSKEVI